MEYKIAQEKFKKVFFNYLDSLSELDAESHGVWADGATPYYPLNWDVVDELGDYEQSPIVFVYYPTNDSYDYPNTYEDNDFPLIVLDNHLYQNLINIFGEVAIHHYMPEWFTHKTGHEVKNVFSE